MRVISSQKCAVVVMFWAIIRGYNLSQKCAVVGIRAMCLGYCEGVFSSQKCAVVVIRVL